MLSPVLCAVLAFSGLPAQADPQPLLTVAETSDYRATGRYDEVIRFIERLAEESAVVRRGELGMTFEGRSIPLVILADPPVSTPEGAAKSKKLVLFAFGNIHAGEVCGKEALLMLAREIATTPEHPLLKDLIVVFAPIFNCDGNERVAKGNRRRQVGPAEGMGQRHNAQDLDLNRDWVKLEAPETRAMVRFYRRWDPAVVIDTHTTNGSYHRYAITYAAPRNPAGDPRIIEFTRDTMLPAIARTFEEQTGRKSFFYGNLNRDRSRWTTYPARPSYGTPYRGLRNRIAILSEAYAYDSYRDRVLATRDFVRTCLEYGAEHKDEIRKLLEQVDDATIAAGRKPEQDDLVAIRSEAVAFDGPVQIAGFVEEETGGRLVPTDKPRTYWVEHVGKFAPTVSVRRPYAYLLPASQGAVVETLQYHGIEVEELREDIELDLEAYRVEKIDRSGRAYQEHNLVTVEVTGKPETRFVETGTILVRTAQKLGTLAVYLLEPHSDDGLSRWNFFDDALVEGGTFPVARLLEPDPITRCRVRPLPEDRAFDKPITADILYGRGRPNFSGSPVSGLRWLDDGERFEQFKDGRRRAVDAVTGRSEPVEGPEKKLAEALAALPTIDQRAADALARRARSRMTRDRTATLLEHENDLYYCRLDGTGAARLTSTPQRERFQQFSPDGRFVSFVRDHDLFVVDVATRTERALTADGSDRVRSGQGNWVYAEEIYGHRTPLHWWSPDSSHLAFLRLDDAPVHDFTVVNHTPTRLDIEATPYPKAGDPNPTVRLGLVSAAGGTVRWADLGGYQEGAFLVSHVGWFPDGRSVYCYVQDRAQTWLDFNAVSRRGGTPKRLFRETTQAWVNNPRDPKFLEDGSFLLHSERTGWRHIYRFDKNGKLQNALTAGEWEARTIHLVDEKNGFVYFSGTRDNPIGNDLYRVRLDGTGLQRLTGGPGYHRVNLSKKGNYFIDSRSDHKTPTQVHLYKTDGTRVRTLDTNPVYAIEEYRFGKYEQFELDLEDGFTLHASLTLPPDFDPDRKYPVWFTTYAGPHSPTVRDTWSGGRTWDQMLAQRGIVFFRCDPRSASGKGACSAWSAYRQLGISELKDIEAAINWLTAEPYIDASRIGISGHSYGGFMTAFAMTHSELFAAGIAGAPVTDWRLYDSIYTERYMDTPQENPEGYEATSVVKAAKNLHGRILILHGTMDNNVHMQNSLQFVRELQRAGKDFEMMVYPEARHGIGGRHYRRLVLDFIQRTIGEAEPPDTAQ